MSAIVIFQLKIKRRKAHIAILVENFNIEIENIQRYEYLVTYLMQPERVTKYTYDYNKAYKNANRMFEVVQKRKGAQPIEYDIQNMTLHKKQDLKNIPGLEIKDNFIYRAQAEQTQAEQTQAEQEQTQAQTKEQTEKQIYEEIEKKEELQRAFERDWNRLMAAANQDMERALAKSKKVN